MAEVESRKLLKKGAEASLFLADWHGKEVVIKERMQKKYRPPEMDEIIRGYRTVHEPQLIHEAKKAGVATPTVFLVDVKNATIIMEFVEGKQVKQLLGCITRREGRKLCFRIGELIGKLHFHGVIHGDLTTSNIIVNGEGKVFLVDFGLGEKNMELEAKGVDLHLLKRALQSTHYELAEECFASVMEGYAAVLGAEETGNVLERVKAIGKRGRYVEERKEET